jgi:hypothetical protein
MKRATGTTVDDSLVDANARLVRENERLKSEIQRLHHAIATFAHEGKMPDGFLECFARLPEEILARCG